MNCTDPLNVTKGQTVCRPSGWLDVAQFFIVNYGLHVFTINLSPSSSNLNTLRDYIVSLAVPVYGVNEAIDIILNCARRQPDQLLTAQRAGALCMVVPGGQADRESEYRYPQCQSPKSVT